MKDYFPISKKEQKRINKLIDKENKKAIKSFFKPRKWPKGLGNTIRGVK